jgi:RNA polymerase sigma-70 factor (ECF subfamily)
VYRYVRFRLNNETLAEDISADVFLQLLESARAGRSPQTNLKGWLLGTAAHMVSDHFRKKYRQPTDDLPKNLAAETPDLLTGMELEERNQLLRTGLAMLTDEQQHVLNLRFNNGFSLEETANLMNKNVNAIKQLQFRALAALNRNIGEMP